MGIPLVGSRQPRVMMRLAVDIGARFVDLCLWSERAVRVAKLPAGDDPGAALLAGLARLGVDLAEVEELRLATTGPLNAVLNAAQKGGGPPVALVTNAGFEDTLALGRQDRVALYEPVARSAAPVHLVTPSLIFGIPGRIDSRGAEVTPPDPEELERITAAIAGSEAQAVAVCLLFAHLNPAHERAVAARLRALRPDLPVSLSHLVDPAPREYERTVSTLLDAWLRTAAAPVLTRLVADLRAAGFAGRLLWGDGRGTVIEESLPQKDPTALIAGGPAAAARAAAVAWPARGAAVALDIGSLSTDITLIREGAPASTSAGSLAGIPLRRDRVDVESLALGGAQPVGSGVTLDAALSALGRLAPTGAAPSCDPDVAERLLASTAARLAETVLRFATHRNVDPLRSGLVMMGGTGALIAADVAAALGLRRVHLPAEPAVAGALGLAMAPCRHEVASRFDVDLGDLREARLQAATDEIEAEFEAMIGRPPSRYVATLAARAQMHPQLFELEATPRSAAAMTERFRALYRARFGVAPPGPGHLSVLQAIHDETGGGLTALPMPAAAAIHVPDGWHLRPTATGHVLERSAS